jgi:hypothetical protein
VKRGWPLLVLTVVVLLGALFWWWDDDPVDLAHTDAADRARAAVAEQTQDDVKAVLGSREPVATTYKDACAVEEINPDADYWTTGPQQLRCTYTAAAVALLPASTEADAVQLTQELFGDRCEVPARAARVERVPCAGGLWFAVVDADSTGEVLGAPLGGAGGHVVSAGEPLDGARLVARARREQAGYLLWIQSMNGYLTEPLDPEEPAPQRERVHTCQEHSGDGNSCPGD